MMQEPQEPIKQDDGAPGRQPDHTRKVAAVLGAVLLAILVLAVVMGTATGSKETQPQAATTAGTIAVTAKGAPPPAPSPAPTTAGSSPHDVAGALRRDATIACRSAQWDKCREDLDQSARLDPEGDKVLQVQRLHRIAERRDD